ncbi:50S ribosomal protein L11 methyltransferase, partial [Burkholderia multivorans]
MSYRELVVELAREHAEALSDALLELGALSVSVEDADADTPDEQPLFGEPGLVPERTAWQHSRVIALLSPDHEPAVLLAAAANEIGLDATPKFDVREVEEQDWVRLTQSQFEPIPIGERIWVVPSWHDAPDPDALVLELDPGLAFGTGSHPTTRLCMEWLEQSVQPGQSVLDYGCGSGILAILAKKCGANPVVGIDIDPQAVESARQNSERNRAE